jgi:hypothetical protein
MAQCHSSELLKGVYMSLSQLLKPVRTSLRLELRSLYSVITSFLSAASISKVSSSSKFTLESSLLEL